MDTQLLHLKPKEDQEAVQLHKERVLSLFRNGESYLLVSNPGLITKGHKGFGYVGGFFEAVRRYLDSEVPNQNLNAADNQLIQERATTIINMLKIMDEAMNEEDFVRLPPEEAENYWFHIIKQLEQKYPNHKLFYYYKLCYVPYESVMQ